MEQKLRRDYNMGENLKKITQKEWIITGKTLRQTTTSFL